MAQYSSKNIGLSAKPFRANNDRPLVSLEHGGYGQPLPRLGLGCSAIIDDDDYDSGKDDDGLIINKAHTHERELSQLQQQLRTRGRSIRFDSHARLDNGHTHLLHQPLSGAKRVENRSDDEDSEFDEQQAHEAYGRSTYGIPIRQRQKRHGETHQSDFELHHARRIDDAGHLETSYLHGESRHLFLPTSDNNPALARNLDTDVGTLPPLTSEAASPPLDEIQTPRHGRLSSSLTSSCADFASPAEMKFLPGRKSVSQRSLGSLGSVGRRHTIKSGASSLSSPARSFLSQWTRTDEQVKEPDPDEEGQEIGEDSGYIIGRKIAYGGFSAVKEAITFEHGQRVIRAVKIVCKNIKDKTEHENDDLQSQFDREVGVWRYLVHPYILPLLAVYESPFATFCIMPLNIGGTAFDLIHARRKTMPDGEKGFPLHIAKRYIYQLGSAIRYLHEDVRVVHRDIKPENCLIDMTGSHAETEGGKLLLCDFGMADFIYNEHRPQYHSKPPADRDENAISIDSDLNTINIEGSLEYIAPEVFRAYGPIYSTAVDIWAYGCVAYTVLTGSRPFWHQFRPRLVSMIEEGSFDVQLLRQSLAVKQSGDQTALDFVFSCLAMDPEYRPSIAEILEHDLLVDCSELYELIEYD